MNSKLALGLALGMIAATGAVAQRRTLYEIEVSAPGTKSQGLRGILYDAGGRRVEDGAVVETPVGRFRWIPCRMLWQSCGRWREGPAVPFSSYPQQNRSALRYRISREERRGQSYWRGEIEGLRAPAGGARRVETPMGAFRWTTGRLGAAQWAGWVPEAWPDLPLTAPGRPAGD